MLQEALVVPKCGAEPCVFEDTGVLECPFFSSGTYETVDGDGCADFMRVLPMPYPRNCSQSHYMLHVVTSCPSTHARKLCREVHRRAHFKFTS
jgi:hypothetical protein